MVLCNYFRSPLLIVLLFTFINCSSPQTNHVNNAQRSTEQNQQEDDGMTVDGLMGMLKSYEIDPVIERNFDKITDCYARQLENFNYLSGELTLSFRIKTNGEVKWIFTSDSSIGNEDVHKCIIDAASRFRFPSPHGGEAEFSYPFTFSPQEGIRMPQDLSETFAEELINQNRPLIDNCLEGKTGFRLTLYINEEGTVTTGGISVPDNESIEKGECLLELTKAWTFTNDNQRLSKITLNF